MVLPVRMFITTNELAFSTQFVSPMSTGHDNCKCKSKIDDSSLNLTTIQVHDSCRNSTVHFLLVTVNLSSVRKAKYLGMFMISCDMYICMYVCSNCFEVLQTWNIKAVKLISYLVWFLECILKSVFVIWSIVESMYAFKLTPARTRSRFSIWNCFIDIFFSVIKQQENLPIAKGLNSFLYFSQPYH